jgi:hypothetical protein
LGCGASRPARSTLAGQGRGRREPAAVLVPRALRLAAPPRPALAFGGLGGGGAKNPGSAATGQRSVGVPSGRHAGARTRALPGGSARPVARGWAKSSRAAPEPVPSLAPRPVPARGPPPWRRVPPRAASGHRVCPPSCLLARLFRCTRTFRNSGNPRAAPPAPAQGPLRLNPLRRGGSGRRAGLRGVGSVFRPVVLGSGLWGCVVVSLSVPVASRVVLPFTI